MWRVRRVLCIGWTESVANVEALVRAGIKRQLFNKIKKHELKYFGLVIRQEGGSGRLRITWTENCKMI